MKELKDLNKYEGTRKFLVFIMDIVLYHFSFILAYLVRYDFTIPTFNYVAYQGIVFYIMVAFSMLNLLSGIYVLYNKRKIDIVYTTVINQLLMLVIVTALTFYARWFAFPRTVIVLSVIISSVILSIWRLIVFKAYQNIGGKVKVMIVGSFLSCKRAIRNFEESKSDIYNVKAVVIKNYYDNVVKHMEDMDVIYLTEDIPKEEQIEILSILTKNSKKIFLSTTFENLLLLNSLSMNIEDETFLFLRDYSINPEFELVKRMIDVIVSLLLLVVTSPIMLVTAILVKLTSNGPVLYKQVRITKDQKEFEILKFRTMGSTAEKSTGPVLSTANDSRVTPLGKYLRSLRIDELPQLFNVLKGEMSLVGPRPERPFFVDQFNELNRYYYLRHNVRAGITGYAQVNGKYATDFNSKLNFDLLYIKKYSIILDIQILLQTVKTLFDKVSSQGVDEDINLEDYKITENIKIYK